MGLIDDLKGKAQGLIHGNEQAIKDGITKAGDFVDTKTGGKYAGHVDKVQDGASKFVDKNDGTPDQPPASGQVPPVPPADRAP
ncbi:antitoxin [Arthrobacter sp. CDRTa11]|uniref:antitoxin n=1 Tax=Arthrobacter sp. CDRTa11 TaxID=2651199 RepID=UPI002265CE20|nr:antitoxin [Arthrobacter sp. CDRTa11]UZX02762.1 antitoxin [Arthrobacter sp. CDRTa11]